jgi:ABC-type dipeptide/oligopeptide/nickel transport system permease subunit
VSDTTLDRQATTTGNGAPARPRGHAAAMGLAGTLILAGLILLALVPGAFAPYDPAERVGRPLQPPSPSYKLGTNDIGQDILSELIWGTRISLTTGLIVGTAATAIGTLVGLVSGTTTGFLSSLLMRLADLTLVLPFLPLVILLSAYLGPDQRHVILILSLVFWPGPARLIRSRTLTLAQEAYLEAARAAGAGRWHTLLRHIWPGVRALAMTQLILIASAGILAEASLSFLGLGEPTAKSWGSMLYFARASGAFIGRAWRWWVLPTGLMITLTVLSLMLISYALEQRFEPRRSTGRTMNREIE